MWGWIPNGILAAGPSRVTIRRKATADIGASRSLIKTYRPNSCSRWIRRRARSSMPVSGWTEGIPFLSIDVQAAMDEWYLHKAQKQSLCRRLTQIKTAYLSWRGNSDENLCSILGLARLRPWLRK